MPIQIRELIVTATVEDQKASEFAPRSKSEAHSKEAQMKAEIMQACVDEVMKVIQQQKRR